MASSSTPTCLLPDDTQVKTIINGLQHIELENRRLRAVNVSYNCIQHNASLMNGMIERLVVTITLPIGHPQRWNFVCQSDGSFQATWLRHADGTTSSIDIDAFNCGTCSSNGYCRESSNRQSSMAFSLGQLLVAYSSFDGSIPDKKLERIIKGAWYPVMSHCILSCHGSDASECCNYVYDGECVVHCPDRYGPGVNRTCECSDYWRGETKLSVCSRPCINGIQDSSCTQCVCFANYQGSDCSECVPNRKCLERCSQEGYFVHEGTGNCFPCGLYACTSCNYDTSKTTDEYRCTNCSVGAVLDPENEGHCKTVPDPNEDKSSGTNIGLIVGLIIAGLVVLILVIIISYIIYQKLNGKKPADFPLSFQAHKVAPNVDQAMSNTNKTDNPLYKSPEAVGIEGGGKAESGKGQQAVRNEASLYDELDALPGNSGKSSEASGQENMYDTLKNVQQ
ncbi:uncharacterized protein LOC134188543 [Corticium candelabrum]|uniref:uncharacterized protein LOC134188543 n=1 Tax=Corticium candelabrum TaxID=121492 RepID=UPI002E267C95|nr:uncharacterized protein LOC134188543 [Corticium candelabrum]